MFGLLILETSYVYGVFDLLFFKELFQETKMKHERNRRGMVNTDGSGETKLSKFPLVSDMEWPGDSSYLAAI